MKLKSSKKKKKNLENHKELFKNKSKTDLVRRRRLLVSQLVSHTLLLQLSSKDFSRNYAQKKRYNLGQLRVLVKHFLRTGPLSNEAQGPGFGQFWLPARLTSHRKRLGSQDPRHSPYSAHTENYPFIEILLSSKVIRPAVNRTEPFYQPHLVIIKYLQLYNMLILRHLQTA